MIMDLTKFSGIQVDSVPPIEEKLNHGLKTIAMSNYTSPLEAATEIIDNSVDERDPANPQLLLKITISKDRLTFFDSHSLGMGYKELVDFLNWGYSPKLYTVGKIGRYGAGGKGAIGYLGLGCHIRTKRKGEDIVWKLEEPNWRSADLKTFKPHPIKNEFPFDIGFTQIDIFGVDKKVSPTELKKLLSHIYKPLLESNQIDIRIGKLKVEPFKFDLDQDESITEVEEKTKFGIISGWFGKQAPNTGVRGGVRAYYNGRLITRDYKKIHEFFGHPDPQYVGSMNYLVGELHLNFVSALPSKTDFNRGSQGWETVQGIMYEKLKPLVEKLKNRREEIKITDEDRRNLNEVQDIVKLAISSYEKKESAGLEPISGFDEGRKPPEKRNGEIQADKKGGALTPEERIPRTPPPSNRVGTLLRAKGFPIFDVRVGDGLNRASLIEEEGIKKLIFDISFPGYQARNGDILYKAEAAIMQLVKPFEGITMTADEYLDAVDQIMREVVKIYNFKKMNKKDPLLEDIMN